jgi:hypothetical protein
MREAFAALEAAELAGRSSARELERLAATFERASMACSAAHAIWEGLESLQDDERKAQRR